MVTITPNTQQWTRALAVLGGDDARVAFSRGINRTANNVKTSMTKAIADDMGMQQKGVRDALRIEVSLPDTLKARVYASSKPVPLINFNARGQEPSRGRGRGVSTSFKGGAGKYPHAFIATVNGPKGGSHRGVFARKSQLERKSKGAWGANLPIYELDGPSIAHVFTKKEDVARSRATEMLVPNVQHEIEWLVSRAKQ